MISVYLLLDCTNLKNNMPFLSFTCHYILNQLFAGLTAFSEWVKDRKGTFCLLSSNQSYYIQVYHCCRNGHEGAVEAVEHTSVSGQDITRILDAECTFHQRFG